MASTSKSSTAFALDFDHLLILDFEATCEKDVRISPQEIIEWPTLLMNTKTYEIESTFHFYVRPVANRKLSSFCTELTGITQEIVDGGHTLTDVLASHNQWLRTHGLINEQGNKVGNWTYLTCGDWDLKTCLPNNAEYLNIKVPKHLRSWVNVKVRTYKMCFDPRIYNRLRCL
eukprot:Colp12_sorted_trinity150504_noHs@32274